MGDSQNREAEELDESFQLLSGNLKSAIENQQLRSRDQLWKATDPEGYKKDMEQMCKEMFGDRWRTEYEIMLREEFPDES
jgi:hypothetical protein